MRSSAAAAQAYSVPRIAKPTATTRIPGPGQYEHREAGEHEHGAHDADGDSLGAASDESDDFAGPRCHRPTVRGADRTGGWKDLRSCQQLRLLDASKCSSRRRSATCRRRARGADQAGVPCRSAGCASSGASAWSEVDLRWGVTDEQKAEGAVLPICLAEIERSRPYFIGLLGERYGWVPDEIPADLAEPTGLAAPTRAAGRSPSSRSSTASSTTPRSAGHAFFYLRDPGVGRSAAGRRAGDVRRARGPVGTSQARRRSRSGSAGVGPPGAGLPRPGRARRTSCSPTSTPSSSGCIPEADIARSARHATPPSSGAHAASRFAGHVDRPALRAAARRARRRRRGAARGDRRAAGAGASALVANWAQRMAGSPPGRRRHRALRRRQRGRRPTGGRWPAASSASSMRGHRLDGIDLDALPDDGRRIARRRSRRRSTRPATSTRRTLVVVDGVDQLDDVDGAPDLAWLPDVAAARRCASILTTLAGPPIDAAAPSRLADARGARRSPRPNGATLIATVLARYAKALDEVHLRRLATRRADRQRAVSCGSVLDELRQHGDHFTLGDVDRAAA